MKYASLVVGLLASLPALAQDTSFKVGLEAGFMKTKINNPANLGTIQDFGTAGSVAQPLTAEYGDPTPFALSLARRMGNDEFALGYMGFSKTKSTSYAATAPVYITAPAGSSFTNAQKLAVTSVDLAWNHYFPMGKASTFATTLGLRYATFEDQASSAGSNTESVDLKTSAYGVAGGVSYAYSFIDALGVGADLGVAFLRGSNTSTGTGSIYGGSAEVKENKTITQADAKVHLDWTITKGLRLSLGYRYVDFGKVASTQVPNSWNANPYLLYDAPTGWTMNGATLGLTFTF